MENIVIWIKKLFLRFRGPCGSVMDKRNSDSWFQMGNGQRSLLCQEFFVLWTHPSSWHNDCHSLWYITQIPFGRTASLHPTHLDPYMLTNLCIVCSLTSVTHTQTKNSSEHPDWLIESSFIWGGLCWWWVLVGFTAGTGILKFGAACQDVVCNHFVYSASWTTEVLHQIVHYKYRYSYTTVHTVSCVHYITLYILDGLRNVLYLPFSNHFKFNSVQFDLFQFT